MPLKLNSSSGGSVTLAAPATASDFSINMPASNGTVLMTPLPAGNTTTTPLKFTSGTNLTTADPGAVEYNGKSLFFTPQGTQRGVIPSSQFFALNTGYAGTNGTGVQSMYGVGVTLSSSTIYRFQGLWMPAKTAGTTSHTISTLFGGTAVLNWIDYSVLWNTNVSGYGIYSTGGSYQTANSATSMGITSARTSATEYSFVTINGIVSVGTGGTLIPQYQLSAAPGGAYTTQAGSWFEIYPVGTAGANVSIGAWA